MPSPTLLPTAIHLETCQSTINSILTARLIQRQHGILRRTINARILVEFIQEIKACNTEWFKRKRIKEGIFRWRISQESQKGFEKDVAELRRKLEVFATELANAVWMVYNDMNKRWEFADPRKNSVVEDGINIDLLGRESEKSNSTASSSSSITDDAFEAAFQASVEAAMRGHVSLEETADQKLGKVFMALWSTAHI